MKISIITATYNSEKTIADTLKSVAEQDYPNIEHIIIDGSSKDKTLKVVEQFTHVAKIVSEKDKGIYDAMNKGIAAATGDVIAILNSDDFYSDQHIVSKVVQLFSKGTQTVYGDLHYVHPQKTEQIVRKWISGDYNREKFLYGWMPPHPTFFVSKDVYEKYGNFNLEMKSAADYEIMLRFLYRYKVSAAYLPEVLVKMRTGGMSNASFSNRAKANREDAFAWKVNGLKPLFFTTLLKPLRKIKQYF